MDEKKYTEIGTNYRFFLGWRHATFAGDLVVIYGILSITLLIFKDAPDFAWFVPLIGSPVGVLFWIIDKRTQDLYRAAINAGKGLEGKEGGFFTELSKVLIPTDSPKSKKLLTHSSALAFLFNGSSLILFILAIALCYFY